MQYGREPMPESRGRESNGGRPGWVCNAEVAHFTTANDQVPAVATASASARSGWDDDGGSRS